MAGFAQNITAKAFTGFLILAVVFGAGTYLIYDRLHDLDPVVQRIREPNKLVKLWRQATKDANTAVTLMRQYLLTGDTMLLGKFEERRYILSVQVDSIRILSGEDKERLERADSFGLLLDRKMEESTLGSMMLSDNAQMSAAIDLAVQQLAIIERRREQEQRQHQVNGDNAIKPEPRDSNPIASEQPKTDKNTFWRRLLLNKKKKQRADTSLSIEQIAYMLDSIIADTVAAAKTNEQGTDDQPFRDTINRAMMIANELAKAKTEDFNAREAQLQEELWLLSQRRSTDSMLTELGIRMSLAENQTTANLIEAASGEVRSTTSNIITILGIGAFVLIILFTIMIRSDVARNAKLQVQMEQARIAAEELARTREEFAANMSHEIRGPLNSIMGISEQLIKNPGTGNKKLVDGLLSSSQHLLGLINPVLDVTRLNSGKVEFEIQPFNVHETLEDVQRAFRVSAAEKIIALELQVGPNVPKIVSGDDVRLRQILFNLVGNAIKFTEKGSITISCEATGISKDQKQNLLFKVKDTGIGIEPSAINRIFDEYAQADSTITRKFGGTGLGLSISRKLVEQQNGHISVKSEVGEGSEFAFEIPFDIVEKKIEQEIKKIPHEQIFAGKEIMICDDDEMNRMLAAMIITNYGGKVTECGDGEEVIKKLKSQNYDLLVLDINLPGIDGKATVAELRLLGKKLPVIAVTGNAHEESNFVKAGFDAIVIKPYQEAELISIMAKFIGVPVDEKIRN